MIIPTKKIKIWERIRDDIGYYAFAKGSGLNYRTVKKAIESGKCKDWVFEEIQKFVVERKKTVKRLTQEAA
jgi:hypothetical protein